MRRSQSVPRSQSYCDPVRAHTFSIPCPAWYLELSNQESGLISQPYLPSTSSLPDLDVRSRWLFGDESLIIAHASAGVCQVCRGVRSTKLR